MRERSIIYKNGTGCIKKYNESYTYKIRERERETLREKKTGCTKKYSKRNIFKKEIQEEGVKI